MQNKFNNSIFIAKSTGRKHKGIISCSVFEFEIINNEKITGVEIIFLHKNKECKNVFSDWMKITFLPVWKNNELISDKNTFRNM